MSMQPTICLPYIVDNVHPIDTPHQLHHPDSTSFDPMAISPTHTSYGSPSHSVLSQLLEDDDDHASTEVSLSFDEMVAYRAKTSELAAILNEDSPALSFNSAFATQHGGAASVVEVQSPSYQVNRGAFFRANCDVLDSSPNRLFTIKNSNVRRKLQAVRCYMPSKGLDVHLNNLISKPPSKEEGKFNAHQESGASLYKLHKTVHCLKLCRESVAASKRSDEALYDYVDFNYLLLQCAHAIGLNNTKSAMDILHKVKQHASPYGSGAERLAYYFAEALAARLSGTGWQIYLGLLQQHRPSFKQVWKASSMYMSNCPFAKALHFYVNQTILDAAREASTLHIVEYNITGLHYPSLFKALAARPGGPPQVRLVGANVPHYSNNYGHLGEISEALERTGHKISECAASYGVPFHFTPWVGKFIGTFRFDGYVNPKRNPDEVLVILSVYLLRYIMDNVLNPSTMRPRLMKRIQAANPDLFIHGIVTGSYSSPFFSMRFKEALLHFECQYDMVDTFIDRENIDRIVFESEILGKAVLNIVACEDANLMERVNSYKQWQMVTKETGLKQLPVKQGIISKMQNILRSWHKDYIAVEDIECVLMGWRGRMLHAVSAWRGCR